LRTSITANARTNSPSRAPKAPPYVGSFIHFLCSSVIRAIGYFPIPDQLRGAGRITDHNRLTTIFTFVSHPYENSTDSSPTPPAKCWS
jgi:hypothetical protein